MTYGYKGWMNKNDEIMDGARFVTDASFES